MPGVRISTAVRTGPVNTGVAPASTFFIVGETERGTDSAALSVSSLEEYTTYFGGYEANKHTYQQIRTFFEEGGVRAVVARATATGAAKAKKILAAEASAPGIVLTAVGKGTWGNDIYVSVANASGTDFSLTFYYGGSTSADIITTVGAFTSLTDAIEAINASAVLKNYCTAALDTGANGEHELASAAAAAFGSGTGGETTGTNGTIAESDFVAALDRFTEEFGAGAVAIPGVADGTTDDTLWEAIKTHCAANKRIALLSFGQNVSTSNAVSQSSAYGAADDTDHEFLGMYFPWVTIPSGLGRNLTIPPDAYVAANRSKAHNRVGSWQPFAGVSTDATFVNGLATAISRTDAETLDAAKVNALRVMNGAVRIYGARSHSDNTAQWRYITHRDTVNFIIDRCEQALEPLVFSTINGRRTVYADIQSALQGVMEPIRIAGGLFEGFDQNGKQVDFGYTIKVDDSINPLSQLETGLVKAQLGVRVSSVGDKIEVNLVKSNLTATLV